ncbi:MAG TPA: hypothetical protein ENN03_11080 [bacterium]|nr:hypothetical protein [bacterium]
MDTNDSSGVLCREIQEQADREAEAIIHKAREQAEAVLDQARARAVTQGDEILARAREQAEAVRRRILSGVQLEVRKRLLEEREALVRRFFEEIRRRWRELRRTSEYDAVLEDMIREGVRVLDAGEVTIRGGEEEIRRLSESRIRTLSAELSRMPGGRVRLVPDPDPLPGEGGVVLLSGRVRVDNRFASRLAKHEPELRAMIHELWEKLQQTDRAKSSSTGRSR